jgi:hypothetical protein
MTQQAAVDVFDSIVNDLHKISIDFFQEHILENAQFNIPHCSKSLKELSLPEGRKADSAIIVSAGPSLHKKKSIHKIKESRYEGSIIAVDGAYVMCLENGIIPDYVLTLDPHPTRIVRWFGDPDIEENIKYDDYFARQDLDISFRENTIAQNQKHIELVNQYGYLTKTIIATTAPQNVVQRLKEAKADMYWWNPLVDDPRNELSITRKLYDINKVLCMNTGGNVGTAAWVFANTILKIPRIGLVGMDLGYYADTPLVNTQRYHEFIEHIGDAAQIDKCFKSFTFPLNEEKFIIDPTYYRYRRNFLELMEKSNGQNFNCTEGGTLFGSNVECVYLEDFLKNS